MAPDLNSLPPSPFRNHHPISSSRRSSELRVPATASPTSASSQTQVSPFPDHLASTMSVSGAPIVDNTGVGVGPGPLRHPRPLTAADLYMQMEKEQEAVVSYISRKHEMQPSDLGLLIGKPFNSRINSAAPADCIGSLQYFFDLGGCSRCGGSNE